MHIGPGNNVGISFSLPRKTLSQMPISYYRSCSMFSLNAVIKLFFYKNFFFYKWFFSCRKSKLLLCVCILAVLRELTTMGFSKVSKFVYLFNFLCFGLVRKKVFSWKYCNMILWGLIHSQTESFRKMTQVPGHPLDFIKN